MDESIELSKLQLEADVDVEILGNRSKFSNDTQTVLDVAHMIVSEFEDEKPVGNSRLRLVIGFRIGVFEQNIHRSHHIVQWLLIQLQ